MKEFECERFLNAVTALERIVDFLVIDTPGSYSYLSRLVHSITDTLITPMNDSFVDLDVLGSVDPATYAVTRVAHYAAMVRQARRRRRQHTLTHTSSLLKSGDAHAPNGPFGVLIPRVLPVRPAGPFRTSSYSFHTLLPFRRDG